MHEKYENNTLTSDVRGNDLVYGNDDMIFCFSDTSCLMGVQRCTSMNAYKSSSEPNTHTHTTPHSPTFKFTRLHHLITTTFLEKKKKRTLADDEI